MDESQLDYSSVLKEGKRQSLPVLSFKAGAPIYNEGDISRESYVVLKGSLLSFRKVGLQFIEIMRYEEGDTFGELSQVDGLARDTSVRTLTDCQLAVNTPTSYQAVLQQAPAWLMGAYRRFMFQLRELSKQVNAATVSEPLESLCQFLVLKASAFPVTGKAVLAFPYFELMDEFSLVSRQLLEDVRKNAQELVFMGLASLSPKHEFTIPDPDLLEILLQALRCQRLGVPFPPAQLDTILVYCLSSMPRIPPKGPMSLEYLIELWGPGTRGRVEKPHIEQLRELGALVGDDLHALKFDKDRTDFLVKANREIVGILARRRKS